MRTVTRGRTLATLALVAIVVAACGSGSAPERRPSPTGHRAAASAAAGGRHARAARPTPSRCDSASSPTSPMRRASSHSPTAGRCKQLLPNADIQVTPFNSGTTGGRGHLQRRRWTSPTSGPTLPSTRSRSRTGGRPGHLRLDLGRRVPRRQARDHERGGPPGQEDRHPLARQHAGRRAPGVAQGARASHRHRGRRRRVGRAPGERPDARDLPGGTIDGAWVPEPWATRLVQDGGREGPRRRA